MTKLSQLATALTEAQATLADLRRRIGDLATDEAGLSRNPLPAADVEARVKAFVRTQAEAFTFQPDGLVLSGPDGGDRVDLVNLHGQPWEVAHRIVGLICATVPERVEKIMLAQAQALADDMGVPRLSEAERAARAEEVAAKRWALEVEEEAIIRDAEAAGFTIDRREDANPVVVTLSAEDLAEAHAALVAPPKAARTRTRAKGGAA